MDIIRPVSYLRHMCRDVKEIRGEKTEARGWGIDVGVGMLRLWC